MTRFRPHPDVLARRVGDELVLVHMGRNEIFALNRTAARLWEVLNEGYSRSEAVDRLTSEFNVGAAIVEDEADRLLDLLRRERLVELEEHG